jgi:hypothetical protein
MENTSDIVNGLPQFWPWMLQAFGMVGTVLIVCLFFLLCLAWFITPVGVWLLYRKGRTLAQQLLELREWTSAQNRQQQVDRLQRDRVRKRPPRRR